MTSCLLLSTQQAESVIPVWGPQQSYEDSVRPRSEAIPSLAHQGSQSTYTQCWRPARQHDWLPEHLLLKELNKSLNAYNTTPNSVFSALYCKTVVDIRITPSLRKYILNNDIIHTKFGPLWFVLALSHLNEEKLGSAIFNRKKKHKIIMANTIFKSLFLCHLKEV